MKDYSNVRGFNYQPGYGSCSYENWMWFDRDAVERELGWGKRNFPKMNTVRLWLSWDAYIRDPAAFARHFEETLQICDRLGIRAIACLFNRWHNAFCDNGGVYFERILPGSAQYDRWFFKPYIEDIAGRHRDDPRVLIWDLCNEPYSNELPFEDVPRLVECDTNWLRNMSECIHALGVTQDVGVGIHGRVNMNMIQEVEPFSDVFMLHPYFQWTPDANEFAARGERVLEILNYQVEFAKKCNKPILVTECCWGSIDEELFRENIVRTLTELRKRNLGFVVHALANSEVADMHSPKLGPILQDMGQFNFLNPDGSVRPGLEVFNDFC